MVTISEGATISGGEMVLTGEADVCGHRRLGGIDAVTGELLGKLTGEGPCSSRSPTWCAPGTPARST